MSSWFFVVVLVLVMGAIALVASGFGAPMADEYDDRPDALVPAEGDLGPQDLRRVRFSLGVRGYRMSEVDALLSRLATQLEAHQAWQPPAPDPADPTDPETGDQSDPGAFARPVEDPGPQTGAERRPDDAPPG